MILVVIMEAGVLYAKNVSSSTHKNKKLDMLFYEGLNAYLNRDFKTATLKWRDVLQIDPDYKKVQIYFEKAYAKYTKMERYFYQGLDKFNKREYRRAIIDFKKTLFINPRHKKALYYLKLCYEKLKVHLKIMDGPTADAEEINDVKLTTDASIHLYACGFDGDNKFVGTVPVRWETTGTLDVITNTNFVSELVFSPKTADTEGKIKVFLANSFPDETGIIKVSKGKLAYIKLYTQPGAQGRLITNINLTADTNIIIFAAGFDGKNEYISDISASWKFEIDSFNYSAKNSSSFKLHSTRVGTGKLTVMAKNGVKVVLTNISVSPGRLKYIQIEDLPDGSGSKVGDLTLSTDDAKILYSIGYDNYFNLIGAVKADWTATGSLHIKSQKNKDFIILKSLEPNTSGKIKAVKPGIEPAYTGIIKILPGRVSFILISTNRNNNTYKRLSSITCKAGNNIKLFSGGFDRKHNFVAPINVFWKVNKSKISLSKSINLVFTNANKNVVVTATHPSDSKITDKLNIVILPDSVNKLVVSVSNRIKYEKFYNITADSNLKIFAYYVDKYGNFVKPAETDWELLGLKGRIVPDRGSNAVFYPEITGKGIIKAVSYYSNSVFSNYINIKVKHGKPSKIVFYNNNNIPVKSVFSNIMFSRNIFKSVLADKFGNYITNIKGNWTVYTNGSLHSSADNVDKIEVICNNSVSNGLINFVSYDSNFNAALRFRIKYPVFKFVTIFSYSNNSVCTDIELGYHKKIKLKAVAVDSNYKELFPLDVKWRTSENYNSLRYVEGITNVLYGSLAESKEFLIITNKLIGSRKVAAIKVGKPVVIVTQKSNLIASKKVVFYNVFVGDTLGKIVSKVFVLPYKWKYVYPFVQAVAEYNKIKDMNLIYPKETLYIPYFTVDKITTKEKLAERLFGDRRKANLLINYKKNYTNIIKPGDKIIIKNTGFISTGSVNVIIEQKIEK